MASPNMMGSYGGAWTGGPAGPGQPPPPPPPPHQQQYQGPQEGDDFGLQTRPMGLKVQYTFDRDGRENCLARWPQPVQIQTVPLDDRNTIGVVDLRICLQAIAYCSPEIVGQQDKDYTVYATDYSEPDLPLVGQGMLSWVLGCSNQNADPKLITGRVTRNVLALFGNGARETLDVRLKLNAVPRMQRSETSRTPDFQQAFQHGFGNRAPTPSAPTPPLLDASNEWSSFTQSHPNCGRSGNVSSAPSPVMTAARIDNPAHHANAPPEARPEFPGPPPAVPTPPPQPVYTAPYRPPNQLPSPVLLPAPPTYETLIAPKPVEAAPPKVSKTASRPSSRASRRKKPTGNPVGRPRRNPAPESGNTSAPDDATDADEGPKKKRARTTKADWSDKAPLDAAPDSLRVAASTSGSLRTMRPAAAGAEGTTANHLQEVPRAPTPIPAPRPKAPKAKKPLPSQPRRQSLADVENVNKFPAYETSTLVPRSLDARSPTESIAQSVQSPYQTYTPEDSSADIRSSPPVPRSATFMRSSPAGSSPILPPMPMPPPDSGFMSGGLDEMADDDDLPLAFSVPNRTDEPVSEAPPPVPPHPKAPAPSRRKVQKQRSDGPNFKQVNPGPPELLPKKIIYNPQPTKAANKPKGPNTKGRHLKRSNTAPVVQQGQQGLGETAGSPAGSQPASNLDASVTAMQGSGAPMRAVTPAGHIIINDGDEPVLQLQLLDEPLGSDMAQMPAPELPPRPAPQSLSRAGSMSAIPMPSVPASDPVGTSVLNLPPTAYSEAPCPPSDSMPYGKQNKNMVKKQAIKDKLDQAVNSGEMPSYCWNCGAIETPTWRKMWAQEHEGDPGKPELSEKPGHITAIDILERDEEQNTKRYRLIKKALGPHEDKTKWTEYLLCNPCGIWLSKFKDHRPQDKWQKDLERLRKRKGDQSGRSKKGSTASGVGANPTSEAYFTTDPIRPSDGAGSPAEQDFAGDAHLQDVATEAPGPSRPTSKQQQGSQLSPSNDLQGPGSAQSRGPLVPMDDSLGKTRRLLFPSPRKDGDPKTLGELEVNIVKTAPDLQARKECGSEKENKESELLATPRASRTHRHGDDEMEDLFGTPPAPPTTPNARGRKPPSPFKTPTRPTSSHRPITRSISKSIRSARSALKSPMELQRTPTRTPRRSGAGPSGSARQRSSRRLSAHLSFEDMDLYAHFDTSMSPGLNRLLFEARSVTAVSPSHGVDNIDFTGLANMDGDGLSGAFAGDLDFTSLNLLSTDTTMPSSSPATGVQGSTFGASLLNWEQYSQEASTMETGSEQVEELE